MKALPSLRGVSTVTPGVYGEEDFSLVYIVMENIFPTKHFWLHLWFCAHCPKGSIFKPLLLNLSIIQNKDPNFLESGKLRTQLFEGARLQFLNLSQVPLIYSCWLRESLTGVYGVEMTSLLNEPFTLGSCKSQSPVWWAGSSLWS